jgi:hypothetical protein
MRNNEGGSPWEGQWERAAGDAMIQRSGGHFGKETGRARSSTVPETYPSDSTLSCFGLSRVTPLQLRQSEWGRISGIAPGRAAIPVLQATIHKV